MRQMLESCKRYITSRMLCYVNRTFNRVHSVPSCESCVVWVLGFVLFLYPITRESDPAPRKTAASVAPSGAGSHSNFNRAPGSCSACATKSCHVQRHMDMGHGSLQPCVARTWVPRLISTLLPYWDRNQIRRPYGELWYS